MAIKLKRNSWHRKLNKWTYGKGMDEKNDPNNLCWYFWMTAASVLVLPFFLMLEGIFKSFKYFKNKKRQKGEMKAFDWFFKKTPLQVYQMNSKDLYRFINILDDLIRQKKGCLDKEGICQFTEEQMRLFEHKIIIENWFFKSKTYSSSYMTILYAEFHEYKYNRRLSKSITDLVVDIGLTEYRKIQKPIKTDYRRNFRNRRY